MIGRETLRIAWSGITANKLRSSLTILGMTIGVASVIVLIAVGNGSSKAVKSQIQSLGTNVLIVQASGGFRGGARASTSTVSLTKGDAEALQNPALAPDVKSASPVVTATDVKLVYGQLQLRTLLLRRDHPLLPDGPQLQDRRRQLLHRRRRRQAQARRRHRADRAGGTLRRRLAPSGRA